MLIKRFNRLHSPIDHGIISTPDCPRLALHPGHNCLKHQRAKRGGLATGVASVADQGHICFYTDSCYYLISTVKALKGARGMTPRDKEKIKFNNPRGSFCPPFLVAPVPFF